MDVLEYQILSMYYKEPEKWLILAKNSMKEVVPFFDSNRLAKEYYQKLYRTGAEKSGTCLKIWKPQSFKYCKTSE